MWPANLGNHRMQSDERRDARSTGWPDTDEPPYIQANPRLRCCLLAVRLTKRVTQLYLFRLKSESPGIKKTLIANNYVQHHYPKLFACDSIGAARFKLVATLTVILHTAIT